MTFQEYWDTKGVRTYCDSHEERARTTWEACKKADYIPLVQAYRNYFSRPSDADKLKTEG